MTPEPAPHTDAPAPQGLVAWAPEGVAGTSNPRWLPLVLPPLIALLTLGLTLLYWQSEEKNTRAKREQNFEVAADQIAYNLKDRMATYEVCCAASKATSKARSTSTALSSRPT